MPNLYVTTVILTFLNEKFSRKGTTRHKAPKERRVELVYLTADGYQDADYGVLEKEEGNGEKRRIP